MKEGFLEPQRPCHAGRLGFVSATFCQPRRTAQPGKIQLEKRDCITQPGSEPSPWKNPEPAALPPLHPPAAARISLPSTPGTLRHYRIYFIYGILQISVQFT